MTKNLVNAKIVIKLSDPWDLGEKLGWKALDAIIYNVKNEDNKSTSIAVKLVSPFDYNNTHCEYFIASPRHEGNDFEQLHKGEAVFCSLTRISSDIETCPHRKSFR